MATLNKVMLIGRMGQDPELKALNDTSVANFNLALTEKYKNKNGEMVEKTHWIRVACWAKLAENVARFCSKGSLVYVEGKLITTQWEDKGTTRYGIEVRADAVQFIDTRKKEETARDPGEVTETVTKEIPNLAPQMIGLDKEEKLPF